MAHDKEKIYKKALKVTKDKNLIFVEDIVSLLPIHKSTFYEWFPIDSDEYDSIKEIIDDNKINTKVKLRKKWEASDNATLQMGLYKLLGTTEERKRLSQTFTDITTNNESLNLSREEAEKRAIELIEKKNQNVPN